MENNLNLLNEFEKSIEMMRKTDVNTSIIGEDSKVNKKFFPQTLKHTHREILRLHVMGHSNIEIADILEITPVVVSYTVTSELGKKIINQMELEMDATAVEVRERFTRLASISVATIADVMVNGDKSSDRLRAAQDILDRAGHKPVEKRVSGVFSTEDIKRIKGLASNNVNIANKEDFKDEDY